MKINGRCAFSIAGLNVGKTSYKDPKGELSKEELRDSYVPLNHAKNSGMLLMNGADHNILPLDSDVYYELHPYGVENLIFPNSKHILFLGLMSFHWGHEKRNIRISYGAKRKQKKRKRVKLKKKGVEGRDYVSVMDYLALSAEEVIEKAKLKNRFFKVNLRAFKKRDDEFIKNFLKSEL